ncbi:NAD(P)H-binding protein [Streptomyces pactum]|uniref:NAD(P)H-binding protein n=1 Tax=Streptomyces pactum TaxID=68249 RepID=A0ABS0NK61_9ACTN|nr:NAD(P)H-binding protein [Streptomyces pactum]MBH5335576.1 NAD(P)H-binding protein [Streptomyces pactum]
MTTQHSSQPAAPAGQPQPATTPAASTAPSPSGGGEPAPEVLVLAATGKTGRRVVPRLRLAGAAVRAASRSSAVRFDWADPATWGPAVSGASAVYLVAPDDPAPVADFVAEAAAAGVERFVVLSGRGLEHCGPGFGQGMAAAERAVRESGRQWAIVRANNFFQNFDEDLWREPLRNGRLALPIGEVTEAFVDADDVADVAVTLLTTPDESLLGRVYEVSGPQGITFGKAVATMARAAGRSIAYTELTPEEYRAELRAAGYPEEAVTALDTLFALHREGHTAEPTDGVRQVLGREPVPFASYVARAASTGVWS